MLKVEKNWGGKFLLSNFVRENNTRREKLWSEYRFCKVLDIVKFFVEAEVVSYVFGPFRKEQKSPNFKEYPSKLCELCNKL